MGKILLTFLGDHSDLVIILNIATGLLSFTDWTTPYLKWFVLITAFIIGILTIIEKVKKLRNGEH